ncbi:MAG: class I SAM-dependent methyltransferase [Flavobacteriales bacterium]|nr:class I SAM-dependent methyltransferase [Flavobacteriales bacterium]
MVNSLIKWLSYVWPFTLKSWNSAYSGQIDLILVNGKKVLNTQHANYSFDSLHRVFQQVLKKHMLQLNPEENILLLGLGGGSVPFIFRREMKITNPITVIEIDPLMIQIAQEEFQIETLGNITIIQADAATWVPNCFEQFAIIVIDVFIDDLVPEFIQSTDFLKKIKQILLPNGRLFINTIQREKNKNLTNFLLYKNLSLLGFNQNLEIIDDVNVVWIADFFTP